MEGRHRLDRADPGRRTGWCAACGPTAIRRQHLIGRWRCVREGAEGRLRRRALREQEALDLATALMRSPRPPF